MNKRDDKWLGIIKLILSILVIFSFTAFIAGEIILPEANNKKESKCGIFESEWNYISEDGTKIPTTVPGSVKLEKGKWAAIETVLPSDLQDTSFCFRSLQQEMRIFIDGELRKEYSTVEEQLFGKTSTIAYVFVPVNVSDAGKILRLECMTDSHFTGVFDEILQGEKSDIVSKLMMNYVLSTIVAAFMCFLGLGVIIISILIWIVYKKKIELFPLGVAIMLAATWLISESKIRQFFLPNSTIAMYMGFFMIMLLPFPFLSYINTVQKKRYQKAHATVLALSVVNFILCTALQVLGIKDFFETMTISHIILGATIFLMFITMIMDIYKGKIKEYRTVAMGFGGIVVAGVIEIALSYSETTKLNGIALCISLVCLLIGAAMKSGKDIFSIEREKQMALSATEAKAQFLANMSHEIRTPINTILGMNEMILRENKDEKIEEYANYANNAGHMLLGLINDILDFSKIEAGKLEVIEKEYSLYAMLKDIEIAAEKRIENKGLSFHAEIDNMMPAVLKGDELRIKQILNNLLSNAEKYTEKGSVRFSVKGIQQGETYSLLISVVDTGIGIREEDINHIFDSFERADLNKTRNIHGTGLGLCITKQLIEKMKGSITVSSEYGKGSCFIVEIPQEVVSMVETKELKKQESELKRYSNTNHLIAPDARILVVDDNAINLTVTKALLERTKIKTDLAQGGMKCLEMTRKNKYDLILMDHMMPEIDGIETMNILRAEKDNVNCDVDIIVLTANAIHGAKEEYLANGFSDYLSKPLQPEELEATIAKYIKK